MKRWESEHIMGRQTFKKGNRRVAECEQRNEGVWWLFPPTEAEGVGFEECRRERVREGEGVVRWGLINIRRLAAPAARFNPPTSRGFALTC